MFPKRSKIQFLYLFKFGKLKFRRYTTHIISFVLKLKPLKECNICQIFISDA